jgi:hypothetical protein
LQHQHLHGGGFCFLHSSEFDKSRHQRALGHTQARIGLNDATGSIRGLLVPSTQEMPDGNRVLGNKGQPIEWTDPQCTLGPVDGAFRVTGVSEYEAAKEVCVGGRRADRKCPLERFKGYDAVMLHQSDNEGAERQRRRDQG